MTTITPGVVADPVVVSDPSIATPRRGFDSLDAETQILGLPVRGQLPAWLEGSLIRTGPAKWESASAR